MCLEEALHSPPVEICWLLSFPYEQGRAIDFFVFSKTGFRSVRIVEIEELPPDHQFPGSLELTDHLSLFSVKPQLSHVLGYVI